MIFESPIRAGRARGILLRISQAKAKQSSLGRGYEIVTMEYVRWKKTRDFRLRFGDQGVLYVEKISAQWLRFRTGNCNAGCVRVIAPKIPPLKRRLITDWLLSHVVRGAKILLTLNKVEEA